MNKKMMIAVLALGLSACAADDPNQRAKTGAAVGAVAGALLGHAIDDGKGGVIVGAAVGALAGAGVGHYMDQQQQEMEQALAEEQARHDIEVQKLKNQTLKVNIASEVSFGFDSASLTPAFIPKLTKLSEIIKRYPKTIIHVVGYTDSIGSSAYNMTLSQRRAQSVVDYFAQQGIASQRLVAVGRGETQPRASNDTEAGRQLNRRVELFIKPIIEGQESEAYKTPQGEL
jgi:outer membrane protein OmpA-like peptidoglycan-associated protein